MAPSPWSAQQRRVMSTPGVKFLGEDSKGRPVVEAMTGIPQSKRRWAIKRDGDPIDVSEPVKPPTNG